MKKPVNATNRRRVWEELTQLDKPENMSPYIWQRLKYTARKLATFSVGANESNAEATKRLLRILWAFDGWHELKKLDAHYTDAIHLIKDVEDLRAGSRQSLDFLFNSPETVVKRLSDGHHFRTTTLRKDYYEARKFFKVDKDWQVEKLLTFLCENGYDFNQMKEDLCSSEKTLKCLMPKWIEVISLLKNSKIG